MKKLNVILISLLLVVGGIVTMSFAAANDVQVIKVSAGVNEKIVQIALDNHMIDKSDAAVLIDSNAAQQCLDAFIANGYDTSAAIDKLADIAVTSGKFTSKDQAKATMKANMEKLRKNESNWKIFYSILGL